MACCSVGAFHRPVDGEQVRKAWWKGFMGGGGEDSVGRGGCQICGRFAGKFVGGRLLGLAEGLYGN